MKKITIAIFLLIIILMLFKLKTAKQEDYLVKINDYTMTLQEFNDEFLASAYANNNTQESKREFLDMLIQRKLMIQYAQAKGLDKDKEFLKSIERFWEQSLLKRVMVEKSREIDNAISIPDSSVEAEYNRLKSEGRADKPYDQMFTQIKWSLAQAQESEAINKWLTALYNKADIKINPTYFPQDNKK